MTFDAVPSDMDAGGVAGACGCKDTAWVLGPCGHQDIGACGDKNTGGVARACCHKDIVGVPGACCHKDATRVASRLLCFHLIKIFNINYWIKFASLKEYYKVITIKLYCYCIMIL